MGKVKRYTRKQLHRLQRERDMEAKRQRQLEKKGLKRRERMEKKVDAALAGCADA